MTVRKPLGTYMNDEVVMVAWREPGEPVTEEQRLLRKRVLHQVTESPATFDMDDWEQIPGAQTGEGGLLIAPEHEDSACGTARCLAGWAEHFARRDGHRPGFLIGSLAYIAHAIEALGLSEEEYFCAPGCYCGGTPASGLRLAEECGALFHDLAGDALARLAQLAEA